MKIEDNASEAACRRKALLRCLVNQSRRATTPTSTPPARENARIHENDYLAHTAAALYAVKKNDMAFALASVQRAHELRPDDPAVLLTEGNVYFLGGAFEKAKTAYETCMKLYPTYNPAIFNCGQYYLGTIETIKGMECIDCADEIGSGAHQFVYKNK